MGCWVLLAFFILVTQGAPANGVYATTPGRNIQFGQLNTTTGAFTPLLSIPPGVMEPQEFYLSTASSASNLYSFFVGSIKGLQLCTVHLDTKEVKLSPFDAIWSFKHQPLSLLYNVKGNQLLSVAYWEAKPPQPRQLFIVDPTTWASTPIYTWPLSGTDFRDAAYDPSTDTIHMGLVNTSATPQYAYIHSIQIARNVSSFVNLTSAPDSYGYPTKWIFNSREGLIWSVTTFEKGTGLTKIDPRSGITKSAASEPFSKNWSSIPPSPTIDPSTNTWVQLWGEGADTYVVSVDTNGAVVNQAKLEDMSSLGSLTAFL